MVFNQTSSLLSEREKGGGGGREEMVGKEEWEWGKRWEWVGRGLVQLKLYIYHTPVKKSIRVDQKVAEEAEADS